MDRNARLNTLLEIPLIEERYGRFFFVSIAFHGLLVLLFLFGGYLLPQNTIQIGGGEPGGGLGADSTSVDAVEELSGGAGMSKPSLIPQPPALLQKPAEEKTTAIPLPGTLEKKKKPEPKVASKFDINSKSSMIPTAPQPGSGGIPRSISGSGVGPGNGISLGTQGGPGDNWYSQRVVARISQNWVRPVEGMRVELIYSFYISANGTLYDIKKEKSSGNEAMDLTAERALFAACNPDPLPSPPLELRRVKFVARFIHPPNP
jgi:outer membrane biosynthesis protein TonB